MCSLFVSELISIFTSVYNYSDQDNSDKKTLNSTYYVDIKSEELRDILRTVLRDIRAVNLNEDKLVVWLFSRLLARVYR